MTKFELETNLSNFIKLDGKEKLTVFIPEYVDYNLPIVDKYKFYNEQPYKMIDRFIPQIVEELYEFAIERDDIRANDRVTSEFADILLYLISILSEIKMKYSPKNADIVATCKNQCEGYISEIRDNNPIYRGLRANVETRMIELLGTIRTVFPRRKYHINTENPEYTDSSSTIFTGLLGISTYIHSSIVELIGMFIIQHRRENGIPYLESVDNLNRCIKLKMQRNLNRAKEFSLL